MSLNTTQTIYQILFETVSNEKDVYWTTVKCVAVLFPELVALILFSVAIVVMYKGIEISHPVYSVLGPML